jgi:lysophospholipase L1-like esterase
MSNKKLATAEALFVLLFFCGTVFPQKTSKQFTIVAFGDSITAPRKGIIVYSDLLRKKFEGRSVNVINAGVGGNTTAHAKERFEKDVLAHDPDLVIMQFGNNDSAVDVWKDPPADKPRVSVEKYEENLRGMISTLKKRGVKVILVTPLPTRWTPKLKEMYGKPPYDPTDPNGFNFQKKEYIAKLKNIAKDKKVPLIDLFSVYFEYDRQEGQVMDELFIDGMHPNDKGQRIEANLLIKQIEQLKLGF